MITQITQSDCVWRYGVTQADPNNERMPNSPIKLAKKLTGLTGEKLAERMNISAPHLSRLLNGKTPTTSDHIERLAEICGVSVEEFYGLLSGNAETSTDAGIKVAGSDPSEPLRFTPEIFELALSETRTIDVKYASGKASSRSFAKLQNAIYEFIEKEGLSHLLGSKHE